MKTTYIYPRSTRALIVASCAALIVPLARAQTHVSPPPAEGIGLTLNVSSSAAGKTKLKSGSAGYGEVCSDEFAASLSQSIQLSADSGLDVGLGYQRTSLDLKPGARLVPLPERLQSLTLDLSYNQKLTAEWSALVGTSVGYHTAGSSGFSKKGFGVDVFALGLYNVNPTLQLALGGGYSSLAHGLNRFGPAVGLAWQATPKWSIAFGYPTTGVTYKFSEALSLGLVGEGVFGTYYVGKDPLPVSTTKPALDRTTLEYFDVRLGLAATWKITPVFSLVTKVGSVLARQYDYHQRNFKLKSEGTAAYFSLGVSRSF